MKPIKPVLKKFSSSEDAEFLKNYWGLRDATFAKDQAPYVPLPVIVSMEFESRRATSRWRMSWKDRIRALLFGDVYVQMLTFGRPLQPLKLLTKEPNPSECL